MKLSKTQIAVLSALLRGRSLCVRWSEYGEHVSSPERCTMATFRALKRQQFIVLTHKACDGSTGRFVKGKMVYRNTYQLTYDISSSGRAALADLVENRF